MPALFIGHGSPMNTLDLNDFTDLWQTLGETLPRPKAVLVISAHWFIGATAVTAMAWPRTIHDFYGFPQELFDYKYPAPGSPELAARVAEVVQPTWVGLDRDQWGLDHGTWSVLAHLYPEANLPVVQLSINALKPPEYHVELGAKLAILRNEGVLILASGNVVHNLSLIQWKQPEAVFGWAERFDEAVVRKMADDPANILTMTDHPNYQTAVPTPDHFIPLLYIAGLAGETGRAEPLIRGYTYGSISMTCFGVGLDETICTKGRGAADIPQDVPADQTNI
jgi:4,5-DOPA dioxygenase extradiol